MGSRSKANGIFFTKNKYATPKGILIAIGGAEDQGSDAEKERQNSLDFFVQGILTKIIEVGSNKCKPGLNWSPLLPLFRRMWRRYISALSRNWVWWKLAI